MDDIMAYLETRKKLYTLFGSFFYSEVTDSYIDNLKRFFPVLETMGQEYNIKELSEAGVNLKNIDYSQEYINNLAKEFAYVFLVGNPSGGIKPVTPHESVYLSPKGTVMQEERDQVLEIYYEHGMDKNENFHEPEDHIKAELDFISLLTSKAIELINDNNIEGLRNNIVTQKQFLKDHLLKWISTVCVDTGKLAKSDYFRFMSVAINSFVKTDAVFIDDFLKSLSGSHL